MLTGDTRSKRIVSLLRNLGWGRMWIDQRPTPYPGEPWGFDNGAFRDWRNGRSFDESAYLRRLEVAYSAGMPYLAIVPDLVADGERSLAFSLSWLTRLPSDWPWYLAVQDGMTLAQVRMVLPKFKGLFLGGSNKFKATAYFWAGLAHGQGKHFHYGRAGTKRKLFHAVESGADSADSAFPLWTSERLDSIRDVLVGDIPTMLFAIEELALHPDTLAGRNE